MVAANANSRRSDGGGRSPKPFETILAEQATGPASAPEGGIGPPAAATKNIAAKIGAAVFEAAASDPAVGHATTGSFSSPEPTEGPELFDEEFRARVIAIVRAGLARDAETGSEADRRQLAWFDEAADDGTLDVRRAERVAGLRYRTGGSAFYGVDGRVGDDGATETWDDGFVLSQMARSKSVIIGTAGTGGDGGIGPYYVSFHNPDVSLTFDQHLHRLAREQADEA